MAEWEQLTETAGVYRTVSCPVHEDALRLAEFFRCKPCDRVLDIGTGNGILCLYACSLLGGIYTGIDIDVQPPGKAVKSIRLFSGGEKALIAICVLFTILKVRPQPLIVFDEIESSLDVANVERFAKYVKEFADRSQFLIITHRPGTMEQCDTLYGVTMQKRGISQLLKVKLVDAIEMAEPEENREVVS